MGLPSLRSRDVLTAWDVMLIHIKPPEFDVLLDVAYATSNNFTGAPVYKRGEIFLHPEAAKCLSKAVVFAGEIGLKLKLFDGYRPQEAQQALWDHTPDPNFLSRPESGSPHTRGIAIDLTLVDAESGKELDMGTGFDDFTPKSFHGNTEISAEAQKNRRILLGIMTASGWDWYENEWWHYQLFNPRAYPLLSDKEAGTEMM